MKNFKLLVVCMAMLPLTPFAQKVTIGVQAGWAVPQGTAFKDHNGKKMAKGGLGFDFDLLWYPEQHKQMGVGITNTTCLLFGVGGDETGMDIGLYALSLYGVKGYYKFFDNAVSPYVSLSLGASQLQTPDVKVNNVQTATSESFYSLGIKPEIGIHLGGFVISAAYFLPMKYSYKIADKKVSAGALQISIGARIKVYER